VQNEKIHEKTLFELLAGQIKLYLKNGNEFMFKNNVPINFKMFQKFQKSTNLPILRIEPSKCGETLCKILKL
jgi:hypothetical protein